MAAGPGVSFFALLAMLFGGGLGVPLGVPPQKEDALLAKVAPDDCLFYTSWAGMAKADLNSNNQTEQLLAEPEVQKAITALAQTVRQSLRQGAAGGGDARAQLIAAVAPQLLETLITHPAAIFLSDVQLGPAGPQFQGGMLVNLGNDLRKTDESLRRLQTSFLEGRIKPIQIAGLKCHQIQLDPRAPVITWGLQGEHLILGIGEGAIERIL